MKSIAFLLCLALPAAAGKQSPEHLTLQDIRVIATAVEARATDTNEYPKVTYDELVPLVQPVYVRKAPLVDPWGTPYWYVADGRNYRFVSAGADRTFEPGSKKLDLNDEGKRATDNLDADIIFQNGTFLQYPKSALPK